MRIFQEKYLLDNDNQSFFSKEFDILIMGHQEEYEERHTFVLKLLKDFKGFVYIFNTCENGEKFSYRIEKENNIVKEDFTNNLTLIPQMEMLLKAQGIEGKRICLV